MKMFPKWMLGVMACAASSFAVADFSSPIGIWDGSHRTVYEYKVKGSTLKSSRAKAVADTLTQFKSDGSLLTYQWFNTPGQWKNLNPARKGYEITYDLAALNVDLAGSSYYESVKAAFGAAAKVRLKLKEAPVMKTVTMIGYTDRGKFLGKSRVILAGKRKMIFRVDYVDPKRNRDAFGTVALKANYRKFRASAPSDCCTGNDPQVNLDLSRAFLTENQTLPNVKTTASGLQYQVIQEASDAAAKSPAASDKVEVSYIGTLPNGDIFYLSNAPEQGTVSDDPILGRQEGLQLMKEGSRYRLFIPPELAFGENPRSRLIKPNSVLVFDVVLRKVNP